MEQSLNNYYDLNQTNQFETYQLSPDPVNMYTINITEDGITQYYDKVIRKDDYSLNHTFYNMTPESIKNYVYNLEEFQLRYYNITVNYPQDTDRDVNCYIWNINQRFYHLESSPYRHAGQVRKHCCESSLINTGI